MNRLENSTMCRNTLISILPTRPDTYTVRANRLANRIFTENTHTPFEISFADSCRTSSGILSHCASDRHRSISVSNRDPDFLAVIFLPPPDQNTTRAAAQKNHRRGRDRRTWPDETSGLCHLDADWSESCHMIFAFFYFSHYLQTHWGFHVILLFKEEVW